MGLSSKGVRVGLSLLAAALMASAAGSLAWADPIEIRAKIDKVLTGDRLRIELPEAYAVRTGDKIRIEIKGEDGQIETIKTRWTVKRIDGAIAIASPDGEPTTSPTEGAEAIIITAKAKVKDTPANESPVAEAADASSGEKSRTQEAEATAEAQDLPVQTAAPAEALKAAENANTERSEEEASQVEQAEPVARMPKPVEPETTPDTGKDITKVKDRAETVQEQASATISAPQAKIPDAEEAAPPKVSETLTQSTSITEAAKPSEDKTQIEDKPQTSDVARMTDKPRKSEATSAAETERVQTETVGSAEEPKQETDQQDSVAGTAEVEAAPTSETEVAKPELEMSSGTESSSGKEIADAERQEAESKEAEANNQARHSPDMVTQCDQLAAHPFDPDAVASGVSYKDLNARKIIAACEKAIEQQPDVARFYAQLTRGLHKDGQLKSALEATRKGADLGSAHSMAYLGVMYRQGTAVQKDATEALRWLEKSAEAGNPGGMVFAAAMYRDGIGAKRNMNRAAELYQLASDKGVAEANTNLAIFYDRGSGVKRDAAKSARFMLEAYGAEDKSALRILNDSSSVLSVATRKAIQQELRKLGFYRGGIDGQLGAKSRAALSLFARQRKDIMTGETTP